MTVSPATAALLRTAGLDPQATTDIVTRALAEDLAGGQDVTSLATVPAGQRSVGRVGVRGTGVIAGLPVAAAVFELVADVRVDLLCANGDRVRPGDVVLAACGPTRGMLTAERTALNLLGQLSGVATVTRRWVDAVAGTGAAIRDTRKTVPGLRALQKYAVRCGGGTNHRMSLSDAALVKDNHVLAAGGVAAAFLAVRTACPGLEIEVECDTVAQVREAIDAGVDLVLLDNMELAALRESVALARAADGVRTEASGGLCLDTAAAVAATGVDYLSVGALTHSAPVLDVGLDLGLDLDAGPG